MSQVYSSGGYLFTFDDDGVNAHTLDGILVSGLTTGFTPWLVEDEVAVVKVIVPPVIDCIPSIIIEPTVPTSIVPEPSGFIGLLVIIAFLMWIVLRKENKNDGK